LNCPQFHLLCCFSFSRFYKILEQQRKTMKIRFRMICETQKYTKISVVLENICSKFPEHPAIVLRSNLYPLMIFIFTRNVSMQNVDEHSELNKNINCFIYLKSSVFIMYYEISKSVARACHYML